MLEWQQNSRQQTRITEDRTHRKKAEEHFSRIVIKTATDMKILPLIITEIKKKCWIRINECKTTKKAEERIDRNCCDENNSIEEDTNLNYYWNETKVLANR